MTKQEVLERITGELANAKQYIEDFDNRAKANTGDFIKSLSFAFDKSWWQGYAAGLRFSHGVAYHQNTGVDPQNHQDLLNTIGQVLSMLDDLDDNEEARHDETARDLGAIIYVLRKARDSDDEG